MHSRVCSPARQVDGSQPRNWARRTFLNGKSDDTRDGTPALARPCVHISDRGASGTHTRADTCLRSRCAGDASSINTAAIAVIIAAVAAVAVAPPPLPLPCRCRSHRCSLAASHLLVGTPAATPGSEFGRTLCVLSLGAVVGIPGGRLGRLYVYMRALGHVYVPCSVARG